MTVEMVRGGAGVTKPRMWVLSGSLNVHGGGMGTGVGLIPMRFLR
jgi:hypothetical protein